MRLTSVLTVCFALLQIPLLAQLSGYGSFQSGFNSNPLYNYAKAGDQLKQGYLELHHTNDEQHYSIDYISGLMIFNTFNARNYYEHSLGGQYSFLFFPVKGSTVIPLNAEKSAEENDEETTEEDNSESETEDEDDSEPAPSSVLTFGLSAGGRHDKVEFSEFDNFNTRLNTRYTTSGDSSINFTLNNDLWYRQYINLGALSNITDVFTAKLVAGNPSAFSYGASASLGFKYYTESVYDTSLFEPQTTFAIKDTGKGKLGGSIILRSNKQVLIQPQSNGTAQIALQVFAGQKWSSGEVNAAALYRVNPVFYARYLAQYVSTSMLNEDIYLDMFSFEGFEGTLSFSQELPWKLRINISSEFQQKKFNIPALTLEGEELAQFRTDYRSSVDVVLSRSFSLNDYITLDIIGSVGLMRNQSDDVYNDFSTQQYQAGIAVGF